MHLTHPLQTFATLQTFILAMLLYPEVQRKAQEELDKVFERKRLPELEDWELLPYITAIAKEVSR